MADITRRLGWRHLRGAPTAHVRHHRSGRLVHDGTGLSFWFRSLTAALSEVPVDDRELAMTFHARTADFQDVTVQATVTYRIADPALAAGRLDFSIDPDTGVWRGTPLEQLGTLLTETAQQHALDVLARTPLSAALVDGVAEVRERVAACLGAEPRLPATGIEVVAVRVMALRPEPEVERALRTPAREQIQQDADRATYERRAVAVERERAIAENELASKIELARREERLVDQRGTNARREAEEQAAADAVRAEAEAARSVKLAEAEAARSVKLAEAEATRTAALTEAEAARTLRFAEATRCLWSGPPHVQCHFSPSRCPCRAWTRPCHAERTLSSLVVQRMVDGSGRGRAAMKMRELSRQAFPEPDVVPDDAPASIEVSRAQCRRQAAATETAALRRARAERAAREGPQPPPRSRLRCGPRREQRDCRRTASTRLVPTTKFSNGGSNFEVTTSDRMRADTGIQAPVSRSGRHR
ncbi:SPFH domain / Band 7 family protein [Streptomyces sp. 1222.5]|nr:SPFH domain/Band 7 family protein [Streptomyces sp. 5112.2]SEC00501.1 SPFH domain / Band 7 family protein [Streptomyces sp. 1222.5]